jgi:hypothetical protein
MTLGHDEMVEILEEIARESQNAAARIAAIKALREIGEGEKSPAEGFAELDAYRKQKTA